MTLTGTNDINASTSDFTPAELATIRCFRYILDDQGVQAGIMLNVVKEFPNSPDAVKMIGIAIEDIMRYADVGRPEGIIGAAPSLNVLQPYLVGAVLDDFVPSRYTIDKCIRQFYDAARDKVAL